MRAKLPFNLILLLLFSSLSIFPINGAADIQQSEPPVADIGVNNASYQTKTMKSADIYDIVGLSQGETLDYSSQEFEHFKIKTISEPLQFKKNLSVNQYDILMRSYLNSIYINKFRNDVWALRYFARALAEYAYTYDGKITPEFYNKVVKRYDVYLEIDSVIRTLSISSDIKYSLAKLYAAGCVYSGQIYLAGDEIEKIKKIPPGAILYHIESTSDDLYQSGKFAGKEVDDDYIDKKKDSDELGKYVGSVLGDNLYYICLSFYPDFKELKKSVQISIINDIYTYNPTLMIAPPIKRSRFAWSYLMDWISPKPNPQLMKYCLAPYCNWLILPGKIQ